MPGLAELARKIEARVEGDETLVISGLAPLDHATEKDLSFLTSDRYLSLVPDSDAGAILTGPDVRIPGKTLLVHPDPYYALSLLIPIFYPPVRRPAVGIHPSAVVDETAQIGDDVAVSANVTIGAEVTVGEGSTLHPGVVVMDGSRIGSHCILYPNVKIYPNVTLGNNVILQAGAVIGSDGFGFAFHDGRYNKIPQMGGVVIHDDVEIGANATVDAGTLTPTVIGEGTKLDNLVQIAHNVQVGKHCVFAAMVGISGSTTIGDYCQFGGLSGAVGHIRIGNGVRVTAKTGVSKDVPDGEMVSGFPSRRHKDWLRELAMIHRLAKPRRKGDD